MPKSFIRCDDAQKNRAQFISFLNILKLLPNDPTNIVWKQGKSGKDIWNSSEGKIIHQKTQPVPEQKTYKVIKKKLDMVSPVGNTPSPCYHHPFVKSAYLPTN